MKKVLIITYYWPPAGGPGVQRVLKFAKYLPEFGWQPIILTVKNGDFPAIDESLISEIPQECKVYKTKSIEPYNLYRKFTGLRSDEKIPTYVLNKKENEGFKDKIAKWVRANLFIPDARIGWLPFLVKEGLKIVEKEKPAVIFSSSPPHSLQIGAYKIARKTGLKWIADFRDPWGDAFWQKDAKLIRSNRAQEKDNRLERKTLKAADFIISVSDSISELFRFKVNRNNYFTIPNGFDDTDFKYHWHKSEKFKITYTGNVGKDQNLDNLFSAISALDEKTKNILEINFFGNLHQSVLKNIHKYHLVDLIKINSYITHDENIEVITKSDMLMLCIPNVPNNEGIVTGKLFEYLATGNFILGIGPKTGDAAKILKKTNAGVMFDFNEDPREILLEQIENWENNRRPVVNQEEIQKYSRKYLTEKLVRILEND
ncbi:MAG TPA: hypothetical protein DHW42_10260 [Candidatus Marinimicrobia bacterium]|nr:hypothetical protein [Candidatus Neomarinimicrobiota bacterium]